MAKTRATMGSKSEPTRGRLWLSYDLRDERQRAFCEWASKQKNLSAMILDMWEGMCTEVSISVDISQKDLADVIQRAVRREFENIGNIPTNPANINNSGTFDDDFFDAMMDL